jgi:RNA polymerase sigma-70 factor (ECF subfamily)
VEDPLVSDVADVSASSGQSGRRGQRAAPMPPSFDPADEDLVARLEEGAAAALETLYDRYSALAYSHARRIRPDDGMSVAVVHEVFLTLWRDPRRFHPTRGRLASLLLSEVHQRALDAVRRDGGPGLTAIPEFVSDEGPAAAPMDSGPVGGGSASAGSAGAGSAGSATLVAEPIRDALGQLSREQRRAVALEFYGGYTQREVAAITGAELGTVTSRTYTAVQRLRRALIPPALQPDEPSGGGRGSVKPRCADVEQAVGWALRVLEPGDEDLFTEHLLTCPACRDMVRRTEDLIWAMAAADEQVEPPAEQRDRLLAAVAASPQVPEDQRVRPWPELLPPPPARSPQAYSLAWNPGRPAVRSTASERAQARNRSARRRRIGLLVATVVVAVIGIAGISLRQFGGARQEQAARANADDAQRILAQLDLPGARHATLNSPSGQPVAGLLLYEGQIQLASVALPVNNADHTAYVLWEMSGGRPVPVGTFDVHPGDHGLHPVGAQPPQADPSTSYAISIENGRRAPDSPGLVVATGQVAS